MMLSQLPNIVKTSKKRLGRGHGSGKVKTAGRGTKGQKARGTMPAGFEGGQLPLTKRLPFLRGKKKNSPSGIALPVAVATLAKLPANSTVTVETLVKSGCIAQGVNRVKLVGSSFLPAPLVVAIPCSKASQKAIEKASGKVVAQS